MKWVSRIGEYVVERQEGKRPGGQAYRPLTNPHGLCVHTTEGWTVAGAVSTLRKNYSAPHFVVGENKIVQMRPLDAEGATLRAHNDLYWQVECVGHSKQSLHSLTPDTWKPLVALLSYMHEVHGVKLARPNGWRDDLKDIKTILATDNTRRKQRTALTFHGLVGHMEVPDQGPTWHWDPGALDYSALIADATPTPAPPEDTDMEFKEWIKGWQAHENGEPKPSDPGFARRGWVDRDQIVRSIASSALQDHKHVPGGVKTDGSA